MLEVADLHAYYGKSHILHGVHLRVGAGRDRQPARPQRRRPLDHHQGDHGRRCTPTGSVRFKGEEIAGLQAYRIARQGLGYVPENRDIFPTLTVRQNLLLGHEETQPGGALVASTTCSSCSRASRSAPTRRPA